MTREQVFFSYSRQDRRWLDELLVTISPLVRKKTIDPWEDSKIKVGTRWKAEIRAALKRARVAVLLVSRHFLASEFIAANELPSLLQAAENEGLKIFWIAVGFSLYEYTNITEYQAANDPSRPLNSLQDYELDRELVRIAKLLQEAISANPSSGESDSVPPETAAEAVAEASVFIVPELRLGPEPGVGGGVEQQLRIEPDPDNAAPPQEPAGKQQPSAIGRRMRAELASGPWAWRSIHALSAKAGVDESTALELLRADPDVVLGRGRSGKKIARLRTTGPSSISFSDGSAS